MNPLFLFRSRVWFGILTVGVASAICAQTPALPPERLQQLLQRFPDADTNRDGTLTEAEARAYVAQRRQGTASRSSVSSANAAPTPTLADVSYGPHARNVLDWWRARSETPTPLVVYIHGGGFVSGDKSGIRRDRIVQECLDAGVSFAAINYRFLGPGVPLQDILRDCARAVQFLRSRAGEWNIDKARIAVYGSSAGAGTSMWLAFHDDLADPENIDPVLRESTRLACVGAMEPQFSYDFLRWTSVFGEDAIQRFGGRYRAPQNYGFESREALLGPEGEKVRADCDMIRLMSKDDPPLFISSTLPTLALETSNQFLHHPKHGELLHARAEEVGIPVVARVPAAQIAPPTDGPATWREFVFAHLKVKQP